MLALAPPDRVTLLARAAAAPGAAAEAAQAFQFNRVCDAADPAAAQRLCHEMVQQVRVAPACLHLQWHACDSSSRSIDTRARTVIGCWLTLCTQVLQRYCAGYHGSVLAYGQTDACCAGRPAALLLAATASSSPPAGAPVSVAGSGKTHTMGTAASSSSSSHGVVPFAFARVLEHMARVQKTHEASLKVSVVCAGGLMTQHARLIPLQCCRSSLLCS